MTVEEWLNNDELALKIWHNKYQYKGESFDEWLDRVSGHNEPIKKLIIEKKFLFGGRTLANRGTNNGDYSNCFCYGRVEDSLQDIMQAAKDIAVTFKAQGGQGLSLTNIRPKDSTIGDTFKSDGIIPFMDIFNTVTASISQGSSRRGALMMSLSAKHPQILDFISIKDDLNRINNANLSVEIDDDFMSAVLEYYNTGKRISLHIPNSFKGGNPDGYTIYPIDIYKAIVKHAWQSGEPGVMFMNKFCNYNIMEFVNDYQIYTSNPCGEQPLPKHGSCNLCAINLSEYVTQVDGIWEFNDDEFKGDVMTIVEAMDNIIDENIANHPLKEQQEVLQKYRNIGIGVMGLQDALMKLGYTYGDADSISWADYVFDLLFTSAVQESSFLAKVKGSFPGYTEDVWDSTIIQRHFTKAEIKSLKSWGLRNCSLISVAPTGLI